MRLAGEDRRFAHEQRAVGLDAAAQAGDRRRVGVRLQDAHVFPLKRVAGNDERMDRRKAVLPPVVIERGERLQERALDHFKRTLRAVDLAEARGAQGDLGREDLLVHVDPHTGDHVVAVAFAEDARELAVVLQDARVVLFSTN